MAIQTAFPSVTAAALLSRQALVMVTPLLVPVLVSPALSLLKPYAIPVVLFLNVGDVPMRRHIGVVLSVVPVLSVSALVSIAVDIGLEMASVLMQIAVVIPNLPLHILAVAVAVLQAFLPVILIPEAL